MEDLGTRLISTIATCTNCAVTNLETTTVRVGRGGEKEVHVHPMHPPASNLGKLLCYIIILCVHPIW